MRFLYSSYFGYFAILIVRIVRSSFTNMLSGIENLSAHMVTVSHIFQYENNDDILHNNSHLHGEKRGKYRCHLFFFEKL